jgi:hypothetical protein
VSQAQIARYKKAAARGILAWGQKLWEAGELEERLQALEADVWSGGRSR